MQITGKTKLLGIIGNPIEHSMSPVFQNSAIASLNLDYIYVPFAVEKENLQELFNTFKAVKIRGFNVTIPHKENVLPFLDYITETAKIIGAANTVWLTENNQWHGTNTDIDGFISPLKSLDKNWANITPLVLGNGGASRAVIVGCSELGCREIKVIGRNLDKLKQFKASFANTALKAEISIYTWDELTDLIPHSQLIVNTTPMGMYPHISQSPLTSSQAQLICEDAIAYDLIYNPRPTLFLQQAEKQGAKIIDGSEMLVQQGAVAFEIWTHHPAPVAVMRESLLQILN
ncbi:shikimate dehydrogenase [Cyanobacterium aponinum]|uniref:shikimate dehydrogenase n=1 Tax=Cyanobacterium aponinum TaxID=379064 RepID=UPI000C12A41A|nr:shikimate dehydrogenase [Cyanobacterium aponinum]PHV61992.1 shikimate dehydrogenase [Cyanobacterium aponinum IPPAS B-1201]